MSQHLRGLVQLTRWREHVPFTLPATLLGINMAAHHHAGTVTLDGRVVLVLLANVLAVTFAFMVNDLEDAPDDARDPDRAARNPAATGMLAPHAGWWAALAVGLAACGLFALVTRAAFLVGVLNVALGLLYSWRAVRFKAWPVVDVVTHALMLSALLVLAGYLAFDARPGAVWWVALGAGLISAYGQLYNQLRDFDLDRAAGLRNTASVLGPGMTRTLMHGCLVVALVTLAATMAAGLWPVWVIALLALVSPLLVVRRGATDMRGAAALDASGQVQLRFMLLTTGALAVWLAVLVLT